jgi:hypothetical protein
MRILYASSTAIWEIGDPVRATPEALWSHRKEHAMARRPNQDEAESRRIINRVGAETEASMVQRATRRVRDHMTATDAPEDDWVEVWGSRIGRAFGVVFFLGLVGWLAFVVFPAL